MHIRVIVNRTVNLFIIIALLLSCTKRTKPCFINGEEAVDELINVKKLLEERSPFIDSYHSNVLSLIDSLAVKISQKDEIGKYEFYEQLKDILANLGDRHFSIDYKGECDATVKYFLPFALAPWKDSLVVALIKEPKTKFSFYSKAHPLLKKIDGQKIIDFIHQNDSENKYAPKLSSLGRGVEKLNEFYKLKPRLKVGEIIKVTLSSWDLQSDTTIDLALVKTKRKWRDVDSYLSFDQENDRVNQKLYREYPNKITYLKIPEMYGYLQDKAYFHWLEQKMNSLKNSNALIIDLRNNGGGKRDLIDFFSNYLIPPGKFIVANLARYKGEISYEAKESLKSRRLSTYRNFKQPGARASIDAFMKTFHPALKINGKSYSEYFYMVISSQNQSSAYFYNKPVYILVNEMTFSAAGIFASTFKGLEKVKIAGVLSDGSSGLSTAYGLKDSEIELRLSHMVSYQKNGLQFDGIGTSPDLEIGRSISQILGEEDYQLKILLGIIQKESKHNGKG